MADEKKEELPDELTLTLRRPLVTADGPVDVIELREPTAGELDKFVKATTKDSSVSATLDLIAMIAKIDKPFLEKLGARDFTKASDYLAGFM